MPFWWLRRLQRPEMRSLMPFGFGNSRKTTVVGERP